MPPRSAADNDDVALRLYPPPIMELDPRDIHRDLEPPLPARKKSGQTPSRRPYVLVNMVASVDGRTSVGGKASGIGSPIDRTVMRNLRRNADAVVVGSGTLRAERLSLAAHAPDDPNAVQPLAVVIGSSGPHFLQNLIIPRYAGRGQQRTIFVTTKPVMTHMAQERSWDSGNGEDIGYATVGRQANGRPDSVEALGFLVAREGVGVALVEGGPRLLHELVSKGLTDEIFLTVAPKLLGGAPEAQGLLEGPELGPDAPVLSLVSAHLARDELFLRYSVRRKAV